LQYKHPTDVLLNGIPAATMMRSAVRRWCNCSRTTDTRSALEIAILGCALKETTVEGTR
jgi:hypothetical protein